VRRLGLAALSGALLVLSFPKFGHGAVAWIALLPLWLALPGTSGRAAFGLGYLTGVVSSLGLLYWTSLVVVQYGGLSLALGIAAMVLLCLAFAVGHGLTTWLAARWLVRWGTPALLLAPFAWVAVETLRAYTYFRFSWCLLGYSQHANLPVLQITPFTAVYGVSFLVAGTSAAIAYALLERRPAPRRRALVGLASVVAAVFGYGLLVLDRPLPRSAGWRVGLVQASVPQDEKMDTSRFWENLDRHLSLTRRAAGEGARLVVWPESAVPFYYDLSPEIAGALQTLVRDHGIHLVFGNDDREGSPRREGRVWVGAKMLTPEGELALRYHKMRLVPFGEYVPMTGLLSALGVEKLVREVGTFTPGEEAEVARAGGRALGAFICYEAIYPDLVRRFTGAGADLLVNITNDAWYGRTSAPYQHFAMARLRAVENRKYLVRAANTGITAVVDPYGRVLAQTELFEPTVLVHDVDLIPGRTFYVRYGDLFAWSCVVAAALLTGVTFARRRQRRL
jgi:apolipoprotein N-acyltransferase